MQVGRRDFDPIPLGSAVYPLLTSIVVPRPIAWVATRATDGTANLAPHSFFTVAGVDPPVVQFTSVGEKDSLRNVRATGEFVVHVVPHALAELCNLTSTDFPGEISEAEIAGLVTEPSSRVSVPRLVASPVALECRSVGEQTFGNCTVVFGEVVWLSVAESVLAADGLVDLRALDPVSRLGRSDWGAVGEVFELRRVPYTTWLASS